MPQLRIALAQTNPVVGDFAGNCAGILRACEKAHVAGAQLVATGEMSVTGYPIEDLVFRHGFARLSQDAVQTLAEELASKDMGNMAVIVGFLDADAPFAPGPITEKTKGPRNAAALLFQGKVLSRQYKYHLPTYGVFDEDRYFVPGNSVTVARIGGVDVALTVCEDIWHQPSAPLMTAKAAHAGLVVCINGSPYEQRKDTQRVTVCAKAYVAADAAIAYVNLVGAQDELVFDGGSMIVNSMGMVASHSPYFVEDVTVTDLELPAASDASDEEAPLNIVRVTCDVSPAAGPSPERVVVAPYEDLEEEAWEALKLGLADYARKNGFTSAIFGLSGGLDSALTATLACDALGAENVYGVMMPSEYTSPESTQDAEELAKNLGIHLRTIPIEPMRDAYHEALKPEGVAAENLQARIRGTILMTIANAEGQLPLATSNKSEIAVGYTTLYGDMAGTFAPLKDVYKTIVGILARWRNDQARQKGQNAPIPERVITKEPTAELAAGQKDTDSLPPYQDLDQLLAMYIEGDSGFDRVASPTRSSGVQDIAAIAEAKAAIAIANRVAAMVDKAEYKRRQAPPGPRITPKAFGRDRRLPITKVGVETENAEELPSATPKLWIPGQE